MKDERKLAHELNELAVPYTIDKYYRINKITEFLHRYHPSILVVGHDIATIQSLYVDCANCMGIPTLLVQDGLYLNQPSNQRTSLPNKIVKLIKGMTYYTTLNRPFWQVSYYLLFELLYGKKWEKKRHGHGKCTMMAVFGKAVKERLVSEGIEPKRIRVTGSPKFDDLHKIKSISNPKATKASFHNNKKTVILLAQYFVEEGIWTKEQRHEYITLVAQTIGKFENYQLIIKLHPTMDKIENYSNIEDCLPNPPKFCQFEPLPELLGQCDVAITVSSTSGLEAMALGKPLIILDLFNTEGTEIFHKSGAFYAKNSKEFIQTLNRILNDGMGVQKAKRMTDTFVYNQAYFQDGKASERIAKLIEEMAYCGKYYGVN